MEGRREWVVEIQEKLNTFKPDPVSELKEKAFFRLPSNVRDGPDRSLYIPKKISFGPYHHGRPYCQDGEREKEQFLLSYLRRSDKGFEEHVNAVAPMVDELRDAYDELGSEWVGENNRDAFLKMMVVDACCALEILYILGSTNILFRDLEREYTNIFSREFETEDTNIFRHDLLLLENQLPLKLLTELSGYIYFHLAFALNIDIVWAIERLRDPMKLHILEVYRSTIHFRELERSGPYREISLDFTIPSATNLQDARIEISRVGYGKSKRWISFNGKKLRLPCAPIHDATEAIYMNAIMLETYNQSIGKYFSSYIYFMSFLLKNPADSKLLMDRDLITTAWDPNEVTLLHRRVCERMKFNRVDQPIERELWKLGLMLRRRYNKNSRPWRKDLFDKYLTSPWAIISIIVVFLSLSLSAAQTIYTILGYYNNSKN